MRGGASGTLPLKQNGAAAGQGRHRRVVCVMNAPTCLDLTLSPEGSPSYDNPARFFANSMRHSLTIANFAKALHHLDRSSVIGVDMLPLAMPGTDVGVNADSKQSQDNPGRCTRANRTYFCPRHGRRAMDHAQKSNRAGSLRKPEMRRADRTANICDRRAAGICDREESALLYQVCAL